jgi:hypothetical protein
VGVEVAAAAGTEGAIGVLGGTGVRLNTSSLGMFSPGRAVSGEREREIEREVCADRKMPYGKRDRNEVEVEREREREKRHRVCKGPRRRSRGTGSGAEPSGTPRPPFAAVPFACTLVNRREVNYKLSGDAWKACL